MQICQCANFKWSIIFCLNFWSIYQLGTNKTILSIAPVVNLSPYDSNLRLWSPKYKQFTSIYDPRVVIYSRRGFIRLATGHLFTAKFCYISIVLKVKNITITTTAAAADANRPPPTKNVTT